MARHGRRIALAAGIAAALIALACFFAAATSLAGLVTGLVGSAVIWAGLRLASELVEVVAETLLPR
jgi:hypothetical protein